MNTLNTSESEMSKLMEDYGASHQNQINEVLHWIGIPCILLSTLGILGQIVYLAPSIPFLGQVDCAMLLWFLAGAWYLSLEWTLGFPFLFVGAGFYSLSRIFPFKIHLAIFILAWALQLIGHSVFEKKSPKFLQNLKHLLVGPLWLFSKL